METELSWCAAAHCRRQHLDIRLCKEEANWKGIEIMGDSLLKPAEFKHKIYISRQKMRKDNRMTQWTIISRREKFPCTPDSIASFHKMPSGVS